MAETPLWYRQNHRWVWHPYTQMLEAPPPIPVVSAQGVYLYTAGGRKILDGISSWWVNLHGHSHPRLNRALQRQVESLAQVIFAGFLHEPAARLAGELVRRSPAPLQRVFFSDNGSTAVEVALKMTYQYWRNRGEEQRDLFLSLQDGYHGDTLGAMAVSDVQAFRSAYQDLFLNCRSLPKDPEQIEAVLKREHRRTVAFVLEPLVQGAGGMLFYPAELLVQIRELTARYGIPLIADEVFTGFGRLGNLFACQLAGVEPDLMCLSKALTGGYLPLGVTLASEEIFSAFLSRDRSRTFFHGHSFTGNALSCAVALESLALFEEERRLQRVAELEARFQQRLQRLLEAPGVRAVRGKGALAVIELLEGEERGYLADIGPRLQEAFLRRGLLLRPLGNVLYFLPPLVIKDAEVEWVFDTIEEVLSELLCP